MVEQSATIIAAELAVDVAAWAAKADVVTAVKAGLCPTEGEDFESATCKAAVVPEDPDSDEPKDENKDKDPKDEEPKKEEEVKMIKESECYALKKENCDDEESELSVGHSVSVLSGVLALASALF